VTDSPDFLTVEDVETLHDAQLRVFGGLDGVRDRGRSKRLLQFRWQTIPWEQVHDELRGPTK
jgi:prophage maintenance system killer protein